MNFEKKNRISRRNFLRLAIASIGTAGFATSSPSVAWAIGDTALDKGILPVQLPAKYRALQGFRIAVLSDIHHGKSFDISLLRSSLDYFSQQKADLLLLAGDFIWVSDSLISRSLPVVRSEHLARLPLQQQASAALAELQSLLHEYHFPFGTLAIFGNHDHWSAHRATDYYLNSSQIRLLKNQSERLHYQGQEIEIFGVDDYWTGKPKLSSLQISKGSDPFRILLAHNPDYTSFVLNSSPELFQLAVGGHTHGGQIKIPGYGALIKNIDDPRFIEGLSRTQHFPVFTSRGLGTVEIPFRFHCPPEAKILELQA